MLGEWTQKLGDIMANCTAQVQEVKDNTTESPVHLFFFFFSPAVFLFKQTNNKQATNALYKLRENKKGHLTINSPCTNQQPEL